MRETLIIQEFRLFSWI